MSSEFQVHGLAAGKRKRADRQPAPQPVTVTRVSPVALKLANELAGDRDVRIEIRMDGSIVIKNGRRK
jgi:hypothetical protein